MNVASLVKDETPELPRIRAKLPNLLRLSIEADDLETCAILANLKHPRSTSVSFFHCVRPVGEPDLSTFVGLCDHFSGSEAITIDGVKVSAFHPSLRFSVFSSGGHTGPGKLSFAVLLRRRDYTAACSAFFSVLALRTAPALTLEGLKEMLHAGWISLFSVCKEVKHLTVHNANITSLLRVLANMSGAPPLPLLQMITISECRFIKGDHLSDSFFALRNFLKQRKHLEILITKVTIMLCCIPESAIGDLEDKDSATIDWDGVEVYLGMMCYDDGIDNL